ncbi:T9SS type A sorting domain-containing protein [Flavobacterium sp.]|uniref:T9SS type A sorting domain-containing protein n=1 Tax=Flavobacterium sp. TaxID=239 RepID=UPI00286E693B|nr:T9SS type A sorting domain-containing protein [Flavobacterium sp.]
MKKITFLLPILFVSILGFSQSKSTAIVSFNADMTAKFTLDNATSKVTLVLTGTLDKWTSLGIGTSSSTISGDVYLFTTAVTDNTTYTNNPNGEWNTISNTVISGKRTVTLERTLTNSDLNDLQMAFDTTNSIDVVWSRSGSAIATAPNPNRGSTTAVFTTNLSVDDISFYDAVTIYPNPTSSEVFIKTKTSISKVTIYSQTGALVKTINDIADSNEINVNVNGLQKGLYIFELQNDSEKTWKKVIVN